MRRRRAAVASRAGSTQVGSEVLMATVQYLVRRLQRGGQVHQPLDLDPVSRPHVRDVVEVRRSADHFGPSVRIPATPSCLQHYILLVTARKWDRFTYQISYLKI